MAGSQALAISLSLQNVQQVIGGINKITDAWAQQGKAVTKNQLASVASMNKIIDAQSKVATAAVMASNKQIAALSLTQNNISKLIAIIGKLTGEWSKQGVSMTKNRLEVLNTIERIIKGEEELGVVAVDSGKKQQKAQEGAVEELDKTDEKLAALSGAMVAFAVSGTNSLGKLTGAFSFLGSSMSKVGVLVGTLFGGPGGAAAGGLIGGLAGNILGVFLNVPFTIVKAVGQAVGAVLSLGGKIKDFLFGPVSLFGLTVGKLFENIGQGIKNTAGQVWQAAADFQRLTISLETMTAREIARQQQLDITAVSTDLVTEKTKELFNWMRTVSLTSPFTMASIAHSTKFASAMGLNIDMTKDLVWATGNFSAAMGLEEDHQERIMYNMAQIYQQGKLTGREFRDLAISFVPVYDILGVMAKEAGMTTEAFKKLALEGGIPVEDFFQHYIDYMNTNFPDAMKRMAHTWIGVQNNIKDFIQVVLGMEVLGPTLDRISGKIADLLDKLMTPHAHQIASEFGIGMQRGFDAAAKAVDELGVALGRLFQVIGIVKPTIQDFAKAWVFVYMNVKYAINYISLVVGKIASGIQSKIMPAIRSLGGAGKESGMWGANIITNFAMGMAKATATVLAKVLVYIRAIIIGFFKGGSPPKVAPQIDKWGGDMMNEWIGGMINETDWKALSVGVSSKFSGALQNIAPPPPEIISPPAPAGQPIPAGATAYAKGGAPAVVNALAKPASVIASAATTIANTVSSAVKAVAGFATEQGMKLAAYFMHGFSEAEFSALDDLQAPIKSALEALTSMGQLGEGAQYSMFYDFSQDIIKALDDFNKTGEISAHLIEEISSLGMGLGPELANLVLREFDLARAVKEAAQAQERLNAAIKSVADADKNVRRLVGEYNAMLRIGSDRAGLKVKLREVNAGEKTLWQARQEQSAAEENKKLADERVDKMKELVSLQSKLVDNMIELLNAQTDAISKAAGGAESLEDAWKDMGAGMSDAIEEAMTEIDWAKTEKQIDAMIGPIWAGIGKTFTDTFDAVLSSASTAQAASTFVHKLKMSISDILGINKTTKGKSFFQEIVDTIFGGQVDWSTAIGKLFEALTGILISTIDKMITEVETEDTLANKIVVLGTKIGAKILTGIWGAIFSGIGQNWVDKMNNIPVPTIDLGATISGLLFGTTMPLPETEKTPEVPISATPLISFTPTIPDSVCTMVDKNESEFNSAGESIAEGIQSGLLIPGWDITLEKFRSKLFTGLKFSFNWGGSPALALVPVGEGITEGIMKGFIDKINAVIGPGGTIATGVKTIIDAIKSFFGTGLVGADNPLYIVGTTIVNSIASGISSGAAIIGGAIQQLIQNAIEWAKLKLGWQSPAPQFVAMGESISSSIALGIINGAGAVGKALSDTVTGSFAGVGLAIRVGGKANMAYSPYSTMAAPSVSRSTSVSFGNVYVNNNMDWAVFKAQVQRAILEG
jgi:tape measure domain-containing protein